MDDPVVTRVRPTTDTGRKGCVRVGETDYWVEEDETVTFLDQCFLGRCRGPTEVSNRPVYGASNFFSKGMSFASERDLRPELPTKCPSRDTTGKGLHRKGRLVRPFSVKVFVDAGGFFPATITRHT